MGKSAAWLVLLAAVVVWFFHESLFRGRTLVPTDLLHQMNLPYGADVARIDVQNHYAMDALCTDYPFGVFWQRSVLRDRELPLWNPLILGGYPGHADSWTAVFSPFKLLYLLLPAERAFTYAIILELALAGLFMFGLLRELGRSRPASFLGALAWMLNSGFLMWYWRSPNIFCWAPLTVWLFERAVARAQPAAFLGAGLAFGAGILSGNIQGAVHLGALAGIYGIGLLVRAPGPQRRRALVGLTGALALGVVVATPHWWPALELMRCDVYGALRERGTQAGLRHTLLGLPALVTLAFPALTGSPQTFDLLKAAGASRYDFTGYIGLVPLTLALAALADLRRSRVVQVAGAMVVVVIGLTFFTPLVKFLYHRFFVVMVFALALLAAHGFDATPRRRVWLAMSVAGLLVLAGVGIFQGVGDRWLPAAERYVLAQAPNYSFGHRTDWFVDRVHRFFAHYRVSNVEFWLPVGAVWAVTLTWRCRQSWRVAVVVAVTILDVVVLGRRLVPQCDLRRYPLTPSCAALQVVADDPDLFRVDRRGPNRSYLLRPNWLMSLGWHDLWGNFSAAPDCVERLEDPDAANVKYLITEAGHDSPWPQFELVAEADGARVFRNRQYQPRLRFDPPGAAIQVERYSANRVVARVRTPTAGRLTLADTWYPGWSVTVDGQPAALLRVQRVMRAVEVSAGEHRVEFRYAPVSVTVGAWISGLSVVGALVGIAVFQRRRART